MSSLIVEYPVEVKQYQVWVTGASTRIVLEGIEGVSSPRQQPDTSSAELIEVGRIDFGNSTLREQDIIGRNGTLRMDRPMSMLAGILSLLQHEKPLFLLFQDDKGTLSTSLEPVGETELLAADQ